MHCHTTLQITSQNIKKIHHNFIQNVLKQPELIHILSYLVEQLPKRVHIVCVQNVTKEIFTILKLLLKKI